ncbi:MAG: oligosaccharide flippase family protein [Clostridia bacterium]|nr:oligosaccharide flippase family protein [Clostridia bacterium]
MHRLFKATMIVTIFSVLTRGLGFILRIILSRELGAEMLGHYQVAMSIFGIFMTLVASGLPLVASRTVAYKKSVGDRKGAHSTITACLVVTLAISVLVSIVLYCFPNLLTILFHQDTTTGIVLYLLPALIVSSIYVTLRSALWGEKHFFAMSFTEFFEQIVRIIICFIIFIPGILPAVTMGEKAALSLSLASVMSCVLVVIIYLKLKDGFANPKTAFKPLIKSSFPITTVRTVSSFVTSLIAIIIPLRLTLYGYTSSQAMAQFGIVVGMAFPLIMIPGTLISSLAVAIVPEISGNTNNIDDKASVRDFAGLKKHVNLAISVSVILTMIFIPAFIVLGRPICQILFGNEEAGMYVSRAAIIMLPMGVSQITSSLLNSMGLEIKSLINYAVSAVVLFLCIFFLPKYIGTNALIVGMGLMTTISSVLNIRMLTKRNLFNYNVLKTLLQSGIYALSSAGVGYMLYNILILFIPMFFTTAIVGIVCVGIMLALYYIFNTSGVRGFVVLKGKKKV